MSDDPAALDETRRFAAAAVAVAIAVRFGLPIFLPQQHPRSARPAQLAVDMGSIRLGPAT
jgi:hypothetical protein